MIDFSSDTILELTLKNDNLNYPESDIWITGCELTDSQLCGGATIVGTEIKAGESFTFSVCQGADAPPIASGAITVSTLAQGGQTVVVITFQFSGTMDPNTFTLGPILPPWIVKSSPKIPPQGDMGHVTVNFSKIMK